MIKKVKTRRINQAIGIGVIVGSEEDRGCEDSLEAMNNSPVVAAIGSKTKEIEHLSRGGKLNRSVLLL